MTDKLVEHTSTKETLVKFAEEAMKGSDLFLIDIVIRGQNGSRVVEVYVDGDKGIGVDSLASVSRQLSFLVEAADLFRGKYYLNVSSPGVERALMFPRQYRHHEGKKVEIEIRSGLPEEVNVVETGELVTSSDVEIVLQLGSGEKKTIPFQEVEKARIVMPW